MLLSVSQLASKMRFKEVKLTILPAYITEGYLPCAAIYRGYFNGEAFYQWIAIRFLPLYLPEYIPIELGRNNFGGVIEHAIKASGYNKRAIAHFRHSGAGFIFDGDYEQIHRELENMDI